MRRLPPRKQAPAQPEVPKPPSVGDLLKLLGKETGELRPEGAKWFGEMLLHAVDPLRWEYLQDVEKSGKKVSPSAMMRAARSSLSPGWEGPSQTSKSVATAMQAAKYPGSSAGGILGAVATKSPLGAAAGKALGWMVPDLISIYLNPDLAEGSAWNEAAEYGAGKVLGTVAGSAYRGLVQPKLAAKGLLSAAKHPVLAKAIPMAERVLLEPATGPAAPKQAVGVPKRVGAWLRTKGPQGVEPEAAFRLARAKGIPWTGARQQPMPMAPQISLGLPREPIPLPSTPPPAWSGARQASLGLPKMPIQESVPGMDRATLAAARMRGHGLPQYPGGAVSVSPRSTQVPMQIPSYQIPIPGGGNATVYRGVPGPASRPVPAGPGTQLDMAMSRPIRQGTLDELFQTLPPRPVEHVPLVSNVQWDVPRSWTPLDLMGVRKPGSPIGKWYQGGEAPVSPFNFPKGYQLGKGSTRAVRPKSPFNFPKGYQLGKGSTRAVRPKSPFNFPKGYQLGEGPVLPRGQLSTFDRINEGVMKAASVVGAGAGAFDLTTVVRADLARRKRKEPSDWEVVGKISQEYRTTKKAIRETKKKIRISQRQVKRLQEQDRASR